MGKCDEEYNIESKIDRLYKNGLQESIFYVEVAGCHSRDIYCSALHEGYTGHGCDIMDNGIAKGFLLYRNCFGIGIYSLRNVFL